MSAPAPQTQEGLSAIRFSHIYLPTVVVDGGRQTSDVFNRTRRHMVISASKVLGTVLYYDEVDLRAENCQK